MTEQDWEAYVVEYEREIIRLKEVIAARELQIDWIRERLEEIASNTEDENTFANLKELT